MSRHLYDFNAILRIVAKSDAGEKSGYDFFHCIDHEGTAITIKLFKEARAYSRALDVLSSTVSEWFFIESN